MSKAILHLMTGTDDLSMRQQCTRCGQDMVEAGLEYTNSGESFKRLTAKDMDYIKCLKRGKAA